MTDRNASRSSVGGEPHSTRSPSIHSTTSSSKSSRSTESTPLLSQDGGSRDYGNGAPPEDPETAPLLEHQSTPSSKGKKRRWWSLVALALLVKLTIVIGLAVFAIPATMEEYASQASKFEPTDLSVDSITETGVRARVQGNFRLDSSRVQKKAVRLVGRLGTYIAREVESRAFSVTVHARGYRSPDVDVFLGTAEIPRIFINIRDGQTTHLDFLTDVTPGDFHHIRDIANDWVRGKIDQLRLSGSASLSLKSGIFSLGTQSFSEEYIFKGHTGSGPPSTPKYNITNISVHEAHNGQGVAADVSITLFNKYPLQIQIPPLDFDILVPNCSPEYPQIPLASAKTRYIEIGPHQNVQVNITGLVNHLPDNLMKSCPNSKSSPLDLLLGEYIHGQDTTIYVRGSSSSPDETPNWIPELISSIVVPVPFPGRTFDGLIKNFSLEDVHVGLPERDSEPDTPEARPKLSATIKALVAVPEELNFSVNVSHVRADADVYYHGKKMGSLDLQEWRDANSTPIAAHDGIPQELLVTSIFEKVPLNITDDDLFTEVVQSLIFGGKGITLTIKALVDVEIQTVLGTFIVKQLPAQGVVAMKPLMGGNLDSLHLKIGELKLLDTTKTTILLEGVVNVTNPTDYSAEIPFASINILSNGTALGRATVRGAMAVPGENHNILVQMLWDPLEMSGDNGQAVGRELISQYLSGFNTSLTLQTFEGTFPARPSLGKALSNIRLDIPTPRLGPKRPGHEGGDSDGQGPHFIEDATVVTALLQFSTSF
ncbi:MAG: regulator of (H+)-ATPase in vacuolar membrane [Trizodia sp. TS-e1964]|nr:MAG: regulator of (H+)-ATPase in vacuolar membrane [Trizodia sp. TS-e1964]